MEEYGNLVYEYRRCWFCGKMIVDQPTLVLVDGTEREFCDASCSEFYTWYQEKRAKYGAVKI